MAIVQTGQMTEDIAANLSGLCSQVRAAATPDEFGQTPDLVVLPELITTPYFCTSHDTDRSGWAQTIPGTATEMFGELARELQCAIAFGTYERTPHDVPYNSVVMIDSTGELVFWNTPAGDAVPAYRKLSIPANMVSGIDIDEKYHFSPGPTPATADVSGTRLGCVICYDRSFPEYWAVARGLGAEVMLAIVSSLGSREDLFLAELQTRALESQMWIVAANRAGPETLNGATVDYFGLSCVVAPDGEIVAQAPAHMPGATLRFVLDLDRVAATRAAFPLGRDHRADVIGLLARLTDGTLRPVPRKTGRKPLESSDPHPFVTAEAAR
ncbi:carbon-nitrogen hydrolase family protein [Gordonia sp. CPCC 206044]|uniref:carbon-nitrogen hydrolase family protein n=1 Tax=Gordonia sp. CPCC 206044 TaxID=3140793 RepID=UPI003AF3E8C6